MIFASLLGTYLDLLLVEMQLYQFPVRLFPEVFKINIVFTLITLPIGSVIFLNAIKDVHPLGRYVLILLLAMVMASVEMLSERMGLFSHSPEWRHTYSFLGYMIFMWLLWRFHRWMQR